MTEISVIIPTWNRKELLEQAVLSALGQTLAPLEVLVCDDGSCDGSKEMIEGMADPRVRWVAGTRAGRPAVPRNRGIRESRGEWFAFLDNDDQWLPDKLERQLHLADASGCGAVCTNAVRFIPGRGDVGNYLCGGGRITFPNLLDVNRVICSSAMVHRSLVEKVGAFPEAPELKALEDYALWLRIATLSDFAYLDQPLVRYRDDAGSSIRSSGPNVWEQRRVVFNDFLAWGKRAGAQPAYLRQTARRLQRDRVEHLLRCLITPAKALKKRFFA